MKKFPWSVVLLGALNTGPAMAELTLGGGLEYLDWREDTRPEVKETGPLLSFHIAFTEDKSQGLVFGAKGRFWAGRVDYEGATLQTNQPISGTTDYAGASGEGQLRFRSPTGPHRLDLILGLGIDTWERQLTSIQSEDYLVLSGRLAFELSPASQDRGLLAGLGLRYPFYVREDAHFDDIGARNNPTLEPKGRVSLTAHLGFALDKRWRLIGYYETIYFDESDPVFADFGSSSLTGHYVQPTSHMDVIGIRLEYRIQ